LLSGIKELVMNKNILKIIILVFILFLSITESQAKIKTLYYFVKDATSDQINNDITNFAQMNSCSISYTQDKRAMFLNTKYSKAGASKFWATFWGFPDLVYYAEIELGGSSKGVRIEITSDYVWGNVSVAYDMGKKLIHYLKIKYPDKKMPKNKISKVDRQNILNKFKVESFKDSNEKIDTSIYPSKDPEYSENMDLIQKGIYRKGDKELDYSQRYLRTYTVKNGEKSLEYDISGMLKHIYIESSKEYPKATYIYNYPNGLLSKFTISLSSSDKDNLEFGNDGNPLDYKDYLAKLESTLKNNWHPVHGYNSYKVVIIFTVDKAGNLIDYKIIKAFNGLPNSSCNEEKEIQALKSSFPFIPLPANYGLDTIDIEFNFDYNVVGGS
jgi:hypothetical protein